MTQTWRHARTSRARTIRFLVLLACAVIPAGLILAEIALALAWS